MLKSSNFPKVKTPKLHTSAFNPLTLSMGAANQLEEKREQTQVDEPSFAGLGAVYKAEKSVSDEDVF